MSQLASKVVAKIESLGRQEAASMLGVSLGTISNWCSGKTQPTLSAYERLLVECAVEVEENPIQMTNWEGKDLVVLIPSYRAIAPKSHFTLFANYAKYGPDKIGLLFKERTCIWEARNELIHRAMTQTTASKFLFFDDDMVAPCGNVNLFNANYRAGFPTNMAAMNAISRIMSHGPEYEIVGGTYFGRHEFGKVQAEIGFATPEENKKFRRFEYSGLIPTGWVGTGFLRITRSAIEKYKEAIDGGMWENLRPRRDNGYYGYFTPMLSEMGEDVAFGRRMGEIGVQSWLDTSLYLLHADGNTLYGPRNTKDPT
jgi:transcriptional regulator with XRE-family HTH domain